jgi:hypothetical protein
MTILEIVILVLAALGVAYWYYSYRTRMFIEESYDKNRTLAGFEEIWLEMSEFRRRNSTGVFIQEIGREPTEQEILTGKIKHEIN